MNSSLKLAVGIAIVALGIAGAYALADNNTNSIAGRGMMQGVINGNFGAAMQNMMRGNGNFDMNQMHQLMHGEYPDVDMNAMHQRMLTGNLTQEDVNEMQEHCPMMG